MKWWTYGVVSHSGTEKTGGQVLYLHLRITVLGCCPNISDASVCWNTRLDDDVADIEEVSNIDGVVATGRHPRRISVLLVGTRSASYEGSH